MSTIHLRHWELLLLFTTVLAMTLPAHAAGWFDDFNDGCVRDGNPEIWSQIDLSGNGSLPGIFDASSGDYRLWTPGDNNNNTLVSWVDDVCFTDSYIRAQGLVLPAESDGNLLLLARIESTRRDAYILSLDSKGEFQIQLTIGGGFILDLATADPRDMGDLNAKSDICFELDIITDPSIGGNRLYGYAWRPGNPKPAAPQISAIDDDFPPFGYFLQGPAGIGFSEAIQHFGDNAAGLFRYAQAQSFPFLDGDYNGNGAVDAADYVLWRKGAPLSNEVHNPGTVSQEDYTEWRARFGDAASGIGNVTERSLAIPEPAAVILAFLSLVAGGCRLQTTRRR